MPHISVKMYPGRDKEVKQNIAEKLCDFLAEEMNMEKKYFSVSIEDIEKENWQSEVVDKISPEDMYVKANF